MANSREEGGGGVKIDWIDSMECRLQLFKLQSDLRHLNFRVFFFCFFLRPFAKQKSYIGRLFLSSNRWKDEKMEISLKGLL